MLQARPRTAGTPSLLTPYSTHEQVGVTPSLRAPSQVPIMQRPMPMAKQPRPDRRKGPSAEKGN